VGRPRNMDQGGGDERRTKKADTELQVGACVATR
jgi:hypothetical protein